MPLNAGIVGSEEQCRMLLDLLSTQNELHVSAVLAVPQQQHIGRRFG